MQHLLVKNYDRFQHYKSAHAEAAPTWIKLHRSLQNDYEFTQLPDVAKAHLMLIWLQASQTKGRIPNDPRWVGDKIGATSKVDLECLIAAGFLTLESNDETTLESFPKCGSYLISSPLPLLSSDQEPDQKIPLDPNCSPSTALIDWFHVAFEPAYPEHRRVQQKTALAWLKASKPDEHERARIMAVLGLWVASEEWKRESGNYVPGMGKFFSDGWHNRQPRAPNGVFPGMTTVELMKQRLAQTRAENAREATAK